MSPRESDKPWPMSTQRLRSAMVLMRHVRFPRESDKSWPMSTQKLRSAMVLMRHVRFPLVSGAKGKFQVKERAEKIVTLLNASGGEGG